MIRIVDVNGQLKVTTNQQFRDNTFAILGSADQTKRVRIEVDGLTTATTRTLTAPDADIEIQGTHDVISANWTARNHGAYTVIASTTATDPGTPAVGHEFTTLVRNGTLTTSRGSYVVSGTLVRSVWHSGAWTDYPYGPLNGANTWTAAQAFRANGSHFFGVVATTGLTNVTADGGNSGTNGGASFFVRGNGATTAAWGNFSSILGGAYDARTTVYSASTDLLFNIGSTTVGRFDTSGKLGIGGTPLVKLDVFLGNAGANPGTSGISQVGGIGRFSHGNATIDIGGYSSGVGWIQSCDIQNLAVNYDLVLQPNGGNLGLAVTPTAGNGLLQLASGTTKANGIAFGTDTFLYRNGSNSLITDGSLATKGDVNILKGAATDAQFLIQVSGTGSIQFGLNKSGSTNATGAADGEMYFGSNGAFPLAITSGGVRRIRVGSGGELHLFGGTPVARPTYGAPTGTATRTTFDTATVTLAQLAERVKAMIDDKRARGDYA